MVPTKRLFTYGGIETLLVRIPFDQHVFRGGASLIVKRFFYVTSIICTSSFTANAGITRVDCSNCRPALIAAFRYVRYAAMPPRCCIFYHQHIPYICHFFLHRQNFWRIKFTPKNATFSCKICRKCQFFALNL